MGSTTAAGSNQAKTMIRFLKDYRPIECSSCTTTIGFENKASGDKIGVGLEVSCGCIFQVLAGQPPAPNPPVTVPATPTRQPNPMSVPVPEPITSGSAADVVLQEIPLKTSTPVKLALDDAALASLMNAINEPEPVTKKTYEDTVDAVMAARKPSVTKATLEPVKPPKPEGLKGTKEIRADFESVARRSVSSSVVEKTPEKVMPKTPEKVIKKTPEKVAEKPAKALERKPAQGDVKSWMNMSYSPNLKSGSLVNVVFAWSVLDYQVVAVEDMGKLEHFQEKLAKYVADGKLAKFNREPQKDEMVIAEYEGAYYRARVMATGSSDSSAQISFVDYGDRTIASYGDLLEITDKMLKTPVYGLKLRLDGVSSQDVSMSTRLSEDIEAKMYETQYDLKLVSDLEMKAKNVFGVLVDTDNGVSLNEMVKKCLNQ